MCVVCKPYAKLSSVAIYFSLLAKIKKQQQQRKTNHASNDRRKGEYG